MPRRNPLLARLRGLAIAISNLLSACGDAKPSTIGTPFPGTGSVSNGTSACGYVDTLSAERAACSFRAGAAAADTLGDVAAARRAISPHERPSYVSQEVHSLTSVLRFIQALFDLPALTARDANSDALFDLFDFCDSPFATPPADAPAATTVVSKCP